MNEKIINVTRDYEQFKLLKGNRAVTSQRKEKIKNSILEVGYVTSPILVNENMEIIDGQGRFEVLKELNMPIEYIVHPGISLKECIAMNVNQTSWKLQDYIKSYADAGVPDYVRLQDLIDSYPMNKNISLIANSINGATRFSTHIILDGEYKLDEETYLKAKSNLGDIMEIYLENKHIKGIAQIISGMIICKFLPNINYERLKTKMIDEFQKGIVISTHKMGDVMRWIEDIYNYKNRDEYSYIYTEYQKHVRELNKKNLEKAVKKATEVSRIVREED